MSVQHFAWNETQSNLILPYWATVGFPEEPQRNPCVPSSRSFGITALAAVSLAGATLATSTDAEARWRGGHGRGGWGWGWAGPAIVGGLALGALAASRPSYGYGYGYPAVWLRLRRVRPQPRGRLHGQGGRPVVRRGQRLLLRAARARREARARSPIGRMALAAV